MDGPILRVFLGGTLLEMGNVDDVEDDCMGVVRVRVACMLRDIETFPICDPFVCALFSCTVAQLYEGMKHEFAKLFVVVATCNKSRGTT